MSYFKAGAPPDAPPFGVGRFFAAGLLLAEPADEPWFSSLGSYSNDKIVIVPNRSK